jgi:hypothetical protein
MLLPVHIGGLKIWRLGICFPSKSGEFGPFFLWKILCIGWNRIFQVEIWRNFAKRIILSLIWINSGDKKIHLPLTTPVTRWQNEASTGSSEVSIGAPPTYPDSITPVTISSRSALEKRDDNNEISTGASQQGPDHLPGFTHTWWESLSRKHLRNEMTETRSQ